VVGPEKKSKTVKALLDALVSDFELRKVRSLKSVKSSSIITPPPAENSRACLRKTAAELNVVEGS
jgi:hypothetical protein